MARGALSSSEAGGAPLVWVDTSSPGPGAASLCSSSVTVQVQDFPPELLGRLLSCLQGSGTSDSLLTSESLSPEESKSGRWQKMDEQLLREGKPRGPGWFSSTSMECVGTETQDTADVSEVS